MNLFNVIKVNRPRRNLFDLSHEVKMSAKFANLYPVVLQEVVPGDKFRINTELMIRLAPLVSPVMHRINVYTHFFFVPNRLVWSDWEDFITGGPDGRRMPLFPYLDGSDSVVSGYLSEGSLSDYFGIPTHFESRFSALPFRAYQLIYNEYYRDQNLQNEILFDKGSGSALNVANLLQMRKRCWEKDYFTSALPWTQRGHDVGIPIHGRADVKTFGGEVPRWRDEGTGQSLSNQTLRTDSGGGVVNEQTGNGAFLDPNNSLYADLSTTGASTNVNDLRRSIKLQEWLERNARGGARYIEQIMSHFGVKSSDARLQRPEYLGGGKSPVMISEVLQTSSSDDVTPQANMAGHGISVGNTHQFSKFFEEHGYIIGIMSVLPRTSYQQGLPRHMFKFDKFDYYFPEFANLGEQPVFTKELYGDVSDPDRVFGYQSRYAEYKYMPSRVHGEMKSSLDFWHLGRKFDNEPLLNSSFVQADPSDRIFAVQNEQADQFYVQLYNNIRAIRPMPKFGTPSF